MYQCTVTKACKNEIKNPVFHKDHLLVTDDLRKLFIKIDKETKEVTNLYHLLSTPRGLTVYSEYEQPISDEDRNRKYSLTLGTS